MKRFAFDLHSHSCLSPCAENSSTPDVMAGIFALSGFDIAALTDHSTCGNCGAFLEACEHYGILGMPGMELNTAEEVHVICLFEELSAASAFSEYVYSRLPDIRNRPELFGEQLYTSGDGAVTGSEPKLLISATDIGIYEVVSLAEQYGGTAYPAHIDRESNSLLNNLGFWDEHMGFSMAELSMACPDDFPARRKDLDGVPLIRASDAHRIEQIPETPTQFMELERADRASVIRWLRRRGGL